MIYRNGTMHFVGNCNIQPIWKVWLCFVFKGYWYPCKGLGTSWTIYGYVYNLCYGSCPFICVNVQHHMTFHISWVVHGLQYIIENDDGMEFLGNTHISSLMHHFQQRCSMCTGSVFCTISVYKKVWATKTLSMLLLQSSQRAMPIT